MLPATNTYTIARSAGNLLETPPKCESESEHAKGTSKGAKRNADKIHDMVAKATAKAKAKAKAEGNKAQRAAPAVPTVSLISWYASFDITYQDPDTLEVKSMQMSQLRLETLKWQGPMRPGQTQS